MNVPERTNLPDVVVCFEIYYLINYTKLFQKYPAINASVREKFKIDIDSEPAPEFREYLFKKVRPASLLFMIADDLAVHQVTEVLYDRKEILKKTKIRSGDGSNRECQVQEYYKELAMCYIFACSANSTTSFTVADREKSPDSEPLFQIFFRQSLLNLIPSFYVTLVRPNTLPQGQILKWVTFNPAGRSFKFVIEFYVFHSILLKKPFSTNCRNYSEDGYKSRIDYRDNCLIRKSMQFLGVPFHSSITRPDSNTSFSFIGYNKNRKNEAYTKTLVTIVDECDAETVQPDCDIEYFITQRRAPEHSYSDESDLVVEQIRQPNIRVTLKPKMFWVEAIILFGSVLGNWFGFAIYHDVPKFFQYVNDWLPLIKAWIRGDPIPKRKKRKSSHRSSSRHSFGSRMVSDWKQPPIYPWYIGMSNQGSMKNAWR